MKKFFTTLSNIWKIEDLRVRIINTFLFLLIYRIGSFIALPGVNPAASLNSEKSKEGLMGLLNMFAGGSFARQSIFALGVMPYISASIFVQLLGIAVPYFQKMQKDGESGRNKLNQITRYLTIAITALQAIGYVRTQVTGTPLIPEPFFSILAVFVLTAGTLFVMWLGEKITDKGIGNGISLIIMVGIIAQLPLAVGSEFATRINGTGGLFIFVVEIVALIAVVMFTILIVQGTRKIAVQYAKRIIGNKQYGGVRQYIPLKVNAAGVMPIIFAQALMFIPATIQQFAPSIGSNAVLMALADYTGWVHNLLFAILIILFTYFYTALTINPNQMADDMKKNGGFVPGVKPGVATAEFIDSVISKITLPGSIFLAIIAIFPAIASVLQVNSQFARFFGGTSLIILVGVVLDTLQQIESHLLMRHYDGLMKTGRITGRSGVPAAAGATTSAI